MMRAVWLLAAGIAAVVASPSAAADFGTADEARTLLTRAIVEVRINRDAALAKFNRADGGFIDRDLYVFCFDGQSGRTLSHAEKAQIGVDVRTQRDSTGYAFGDVLYRDARQGVVKTFDYLRPRPGDTRAVPKRSYVARLGGLVCGVGYYQ